MGDVERMLGQVSLAGTTAGAEEEERDGQASAAASFTAAPSAAASAASSSSSTTAASSIPASAAASFSSSSNGSIGRGSAATALHCASDVVNARIQRDTRANIESKFRRPPPTVLSAEEATYEHNSQPHARCVCHSPCFTSLQFQHSRRLPSLTSLACLRSLGVLFVFSRLMKAKDDDWNALMSSGVGFGERHSHLALNAAYRDLRAGAGFEDEDEDEDAESQLSEESEDDDEELAC